MSVNRRTANIAIKPVTIVNKTSQRALPALSEGLGLGFRVSILGSLVAGAERRLSFALLFPFGALGVKLIVFESDAEASELPTCPTGAKPRDGNRPAT